MGHGTVSVMWRRASPSPMSLAEIWVFWALSITIFRGEDGDGSTDWGAGRTGRKTQCSRDRLQALTPRRRASPHVMVHVYAMKSAFRRQAFSDLPSGFRLAPAVPLHGGQEPGRECILLGCSVAPIGSLNFAHFRNPLCRIQANLFFTLNNILRFFQMKFSLMHRRRSTGGGRRSRLERPVGVAAPACAPSQRARCPG